MKAETAHRARDRPLTLTYYVRGIMMFMILGNIPVMSVQIMGLHKLACTHPILLCAWATLSAKLIRIREIKVSMELKEHACNA